MEHGWNGLDTDFKDFFPDPCLIRSIRVPLNLDDFLHHRSVLRNESKKVNPAV